MDSSRKLKRLSPKALSSQFLEDAALCINEVWQYVGGDCVQACEQEGERLTNSAAVECCIDADRPTSICRDQVRSARFMGELRRLIDVHGYPAVLRALCNRFPLI